MPMTYTTLVAPKTTAGSIASWVNYSKIDSNLDSVLQEAQTLLYQMLRVREMTTTLRFTMTQGLASYALPTRFLDPIGRILDTSETLDLVHKDEGYLLSCRSFSELNGDFGTDPFTTTLGSTNIQVGLTSNNFSQDSSIYIAGADPVGGLTLDGTYEITAIGTNSFTIAADSPATSSATGGGALATYTVQNLSLGSPYFWSIIDQRVRFDVAFNDPRTLALRYYQSLPLLASDNLTNFLTNRYPHLLRAACLAAAADFMKDDAEYNKAMTRLASLIERTSVEGDLIYRGAEIMTENP